jgi:hypothetical protein
MLAMWVKVRIKPDQRKKFLDAIEVDALGSERDEPGCLRFNVLQDEKDPNVYYFFELYKDQPRWRRIGPCRTTPRGAPPRTPSMGPPSPRAARRCSRRRARTGGRSSL